MTRGIIDLKAAIFYEMKIYLEIPITFPIIDRYEQKKKVPARA